MNDKSIEVITFGAGCFWGVEAEFRKMNGVIDVVVGYMGGHTEHPTYEQVCTHTTGHAEVAQVVYGPEHVTCDQLLQKFWEIHDPTQVNRQGPDVGDQYRSVIFYSTLEQRATAEKSKAELKASRRFSKPIATSIELAQTFWRAEEYHQRYFEKTGKAVCH